MLRLPTQNADDIPLDDDGPTFLISNEAEPDDAYVGPYFTGEEEGSLEPAVRLVASLGETRPYGQPPTLE